MKLHCREEIPDFRFEGRSSMLIPIKHENMTARRWPVITLGLIAINVLVFLFTMYRDRRRGAATGRSKISHSDSGGSASGIEDAIRVAAPGRRLQGKAIREAWKQVQNPYRDIIDPYDAKIKMTEDASKLQQEMDSLNDQFVKLSASFDYEQYAFIPAQPRAISYLTANFLHGGWLHIIGNMWFLWLAGFVLEDVWGRWLYSAFYLIAGAAASAVLCLDKSGKHHADPGSVRRGGRPYGRISGALSENED